MKNKIWRVIYLIFLIGIVLLILVLMLVAQEKTPEISNVDLLKQEWILIIIQSIVVQQFYSTLKKIK